MESMGLKRTTPELFFELREKRKKERKMERSIIEVYKRWARLDPAQVKSGSCRSRAVITVKGTRSGPCTHQGIPKSRYSLLSAEEAKAEAW